MTPRKRMAAARRTSPTCKKLAAVLASLKATRCAGACGGLDRLCARQRIHSQVGTEGWSSRSNKRIDLLSAIREPGEMIRGSEFA